jgi:hypothetical protein
MKLIDRKLNEEKVETVGGSEVNMRLSEDAGKMVFEMFTNKIYSDKEGSIVREITSNCFDSHIEAGTPEKPVIVEMQEINGTSYICFIDEGMGMSKDRVENTYSVYFKSTKRATNDQIGGFGIGGKTPLAYGTKRFFNVTRYNGVEYTYEIYTGENNPVIILLGEMPTDRPNGTEIRVPIVSGDKDTFVDAVRQQLHYFENIIFKGFVQSYNGQSIDNQLNNYTIYKGKNFLYRDGYKHRGLHLAVGQVAYPLDTTKVESYARNKGIELDNGMFNINVALKMDIGKVEVTTSRENIDYTDSTINAILTKIKEVREELVDLFIKQTDNVKTVRQWYAFKKESEYLNLGDDNIYVGSIIDKNNIVLPNFKLSGYRLPSHEQMFMKLFMTRERFGKVEPKRSTYGCFTDYNTLESFNADRNNVFHLDWSATPSNPRYKKSYLKDNSTHDRFYIMYKTQPSLDEFAKNIGLSEVYKYVPLSKEEIAKVEKYENDRKMENMVDFSYNKDELTKRVRRNDVYENRVSKLLVKREVVEKILNNVRSEYHQYLVENTDNYNEVEAPESYIAEKKENLKRYSKADGELNCATYDFYSARNSEKIDMNMLADFEGEVIYGGADDSTNLIKAGKIENAIGNKIVNTYDINNGKTDGILFIRVANSKVVLLEELDNSTPVEEYFTRFKSLKKKVRFVRKLATLIHIVRENISTANTSSYYKYYNKDANLTAKVEKLKKKLDSLGEKLGGDEYKTARGLIQVMPPFVSTWIESIDLKDHPMVKQSVEIENTLKERDRMLSLFNTYDIRNLESSVNRNEKKIKDGYEVDMDVHKADKKRLNNIKQLIELALEI